MDFDAVSRNLTRYINNHHTQLQQVPVIQSQLLELGALVTSVEHYRAQGYSIAPENLRNGDFRLKRSSGGKPWNFSWFLATRGPRSVEIHTNMTSGGAYGEDKARYVVDVGVCEPGTLPTSKKEQKEWLAIDNQFLITFVEAKKLTIYPMLLAQFIGIVHEIKPQFLSKDLENTEFEAEGHFRPTLVTTGPWARLCEQIYKAYDSRGFRIRVLPNLDLILANLRSDVAPEDPFK
jgi:hypothetical protein